MNAFSFKLPKLWVFYYILLDTCPESNRALCQPAFSVLQLHPLTIPLDYSKQLFSFLGAYTLQMLDDDHLPLRD